MSENDKINVLYEGEARITKASKALQQKAGTGDIDAALIKKADKFIEDNTEDFEPLAAELLQRLGIFLLTSVKSTIIRHNPKRLWLMP